MAWAILVVTGFLETCWAVGLKYTDGFTRPIPSIVTVAAIVGSMVLLSVALRILPVSVAYPAWVGIGALGTVVVGILFLDEAWSPLSLFFVALLGIAVVGLGATTSTH